MFRLLILAGLALSLTVTPLTSSATSRLALVFGIDRYENLPDLANAGNDARAVSDQLNALGFEVMLREGATRREVYRAVDEFESRLTNDGGTGLVFFAGHGIQADGRNYLIPSDAQVEVESDLEAEAIHAGRILESMARAGNSLNILVLDACRDNPLPRRTRSAARGLTVTSIPSGARGTAILYAAGEGQVAQEGPEGGHGIFTQALLDALEMPNLKLEEVIKQVTRGVLEKTDGHQRPWSLASIQGDFYFNPKEVGIADDLSIDTGSASDREAMAGDVWQMIKGSDDSELLSSFRQRFSDTRYAMAAESRIAMLSLQEPSSPAGGAATAVAEIRKFGPHEMVHVDNGCFMMGSQPGTPGRENDETPHHLCVGGFLIDRYEVTFDAYDDFAKSTDRELPDDDGMGRGKRPVINVDWDDARAYAEWASEKYGARFRLPTEAEWEYACRSGGKVERFCGGDDPSLLAVYDQESTEVVGTKNPNGLGIYDMSGNAIEMTCSPYVSSGWIHNAGYEGQEMTCEKRFYSDVGNRIISHAFRGGYWRSPEREVRAHARRYNASGLGPAPRPLYVLGFRLVATELGTPGSIGAASEGSGTDSQSGKKGQLQSASSSSEKCTIWDDPDYAAFIDQFPATNGGNFGVRGQNENCKP